MKVTLKQAAEKIMQAKSINVYGHIKTDCDCVSSLLAFGLMCEHLGKKVALFVDSAYDETLLHLPGLSKINSKKKLNADLFVSLDTATADRLGKYQAEFLLANNNLRIDHHQTEVAYAKAEYIDSNLPACCLILKEFQKLLNVPDSDELNFLLLSGVLADTGSFRFNSTNARTFELAADMIRNSTFNYNDAVTPLFQTISKTKRLVQARALSNAKFYNNDQIALQFVSNADLKELDATIAETSGMSFMVLDIATTKIAISVTEGELGAFSVTFYSKGSIDISGCARSFGGGGHTGAAGCKLYGKAKDILPKVVAAAQKALEEQTK